MEDSSNKNKMMIYPTDIKSVWYDDNGQESNEIDIWSYCQFFAEHIQKKVAEDKHDGISLMDYAEKVERNQKEHLEKLVEFTEDGTICDFQKKMYDSYHICVNAWALCNLCLFINEIVKRKYVVLLKPTIADTLAEIKDLDSITFTNKDGSTTISRNEKLKSAILSVLKENKSNEYETEEFAYRKDIFTNEMAQIEFFYYLSTFFEQFFKIKRRGKLSNMESFIIGYFLKWFKLSPAIVSKSRLRQLRMGFATLGQERLFKLSLNDTTITHQWQFIKYKDWRNGRINPLKQEVEEMKAGESIYITRH